MVHEANSRDPNGRASLQSMPAISACAHRHPPTEVHPTASIVRRLVRGALSMRAAEMGQLNAPFHRHCRP